MFELYAGKLIPLLERENKPIWKYTLEQERIRSGQAEDVLIARMDQTLSVMEDAAKKGRMEPLKSVSGMTGGNSYLYDAHCRKGHAILEGIASEAVAMALSSGEVNAAMGRIVACPTAGSCGIVPAALLACRDKYKKDRTEIIRALFTASGVGIIIASRATLSGAEGGCQAECGSAAAMAAAAVVELCGGAPAAAFHAAAMAYKNIIGLICDPVAGLVEIPCIKRNAMGVLNALLSADLALAGIPSYIPFDEVLDAVRQVGAEMPKSQKETAQGGLALTGAAQKIRQSLGKWQTEL